MLGGKHYGFIKGLVTSQTNLATKSTDSLHIRNLAVTVQGNYVVKKALEIFLGIRCIRVLSPGLVPLLFPVQGAEVLRIQTMNSLNSFNGRKQQGLNVFVPWI